VLQSDGPCPLVDHTLRKKPKSSTTSVNVNVRVVCVQSPGHIFTFVITIGGKTFSQGFVGQDAGLGEIPDGLAHLKVDVSTNSFIKEVILFDDPWGKKIDGHFHVFITVKIFHKVEVANVEAHIMCLWSVENTVPMQFGSCHVGGARGKFPMIVYQISPHCDSALGLLDHLKQTRKVK
jgi:hypothetical protein